jgi:hypothetical protein
MKYRTDGCLFEPPSQKDFRAVFKDAPIPDKVDLREYCTVVEDQGQIGSCTANAAVGAMEYLYKRRQGHSPDLSRLFVYFNSRRIRGSTAVDGGAPICDAMASIVSFGACLEEIWPYDPAKFAFEPSQDAYADAMRHEAIQYSRVPSGRGSMQALAQGLPVVFGSTFPQRCFEEAGRTGVMPIASPDEIYQVRSGHAMLVVGYDKNEQMFIVRNSWGQDWGDRGYCKIPFTLMDMAGRPDSFWIVGDLESEERPGNMKIIRPRRDVAASTPAAAPAIKLGEMASTASRLRDEIRSSLDKDIASSSRKIDTLLSGGTVKHNPAPAEQRAISICAACGGSGNCDFCDGKGKACTHCAGDGNCPTCGGTGHV